jgi:preprotein translocase subunit SecA
MDGLRESIGLRAYGQKDPLLEYKSEAFREFESLMEQIKLEVVHNSFRSASSAEAFHKFLSQLPRNKQSHPQPQSALVDSGNTTTTSSSGTTETTSSSAVTSSSAPALDDKELASEVSAILTDSRPAKPKIGAKTKPAPAKADSNSKVKRNDPCPCGSGKKYKNCCGAHAA